MEVGGHCWNHKNRRFYLSIMSRLFYRDLRSHISFIILLVHIELIGHFLNIFNDFYPKMKV